MDHECPTCGQNVPTVMPTADRPGVDADGMPFFDYHQHRDTVGWGPSSLVWCPMSGRTTAED